MLQSAGKTFLCCPQHSATLCAAEDATTRKVRPPTWKTPCSWCRVWVQHACHAWWVQSSSTSPGERFHGEVRTARDPCAVQAVEGLGGWRTGVIAHMMAVLALPPRDGCRMRVSLLSR